MSIHGVSQSSGVDRMLDLEKADGGVLFHIHDKAATNREQIVVTRAAIDGLLASPEGPTATLEGTAPDKGDAKLLDVQIKKGDVLLWVRTAASGSGWDIAVGLDDFIEAFEAAA